MYNAHIYIYIPPSFVGWSSAKTSGGSSAIAAAQAGDARTAETLQICTIVELLDFGTPTIWIILRGCLFWQDGF